MTHNLHFSREIIPWERRNQLLAWQQLAGSYQTSRLRSEQFHHLKTASCHLPPVLEHSQRALLHTGSDWERTKDMSRFSLHKCSRKFSVVIHWLLISGKGLSLSLKILGRGALQLLTWFYFRNPLLVWYAVVFIFHASLREDETDKLPTTGEREVK